MQYNSYRANKDNTQSPWRRGGAAGLRDHSTPVSTWTSRPGASADGTGATPRSHHYSVSSPTTSASSISSQGGLRPARANIGRAPTEMEMLQSPSRGIEPSSSRRGGGTSGSGSLAPGQDDRQFNLMNPAVQDRYRQHIGEKLERWQERYRSDPGSKQRREELDTILLDFREFLPRRARYCKRGRDS